MWDEPTLVSFLIVFLLYACYQPLRFSIEDPERQARYAAVFAIIAGAFVPLNFIAVRMAESLVHPRVLDATGGSMPGSMRLTFLVSLVGMACLFVTLWKYELASKHADVPAARAQAQARRRRGPVGPQPAPLGGAAALMPALPLDEAGKYVAAAYLVFLALILIYVAIMAGRAGAHRARPGRGARRCSSGRAAADDERETVAPLSELLALGASHKTAPLAVRERLALLDGQVEPFLHELVAHADITEAVAVSTCNRTELYIVVGDPEEAEVAAAGRCWHRRAGMRDGVRTRSTPSRNCDAARHLYRVVSGLESMIVGEAEIQGQVKRAYERALAARTTGPLTNRLFRAALATGKRVRTRDGDLGPATRPSRRSRWTRRGAALGDLAERHVVHRRRGRHGRADRARVPRPRRDDDVRGQPPARPRDRAGGALRRVLRLVRRAARRAGAGRRRRVLHRVAARDHRRRGARRGDGGARAPAAAARRPRGAARHRRRRARRSTA